VYTKKSGAVSEFYAGSRFTKIAAASSEQAGRSALDRHSQPPPLKTFH